MSIKHQRCSTENQADAIRRYADERGYQIIKTYSDAGRKRTTYSRPRRSV
ncbi:recombinase family protein [uncultured Roseobacter sp.]|nr:recombinase family protein [uncultured Roseobacter sp.]